jgi:hypothetical protein
LPIPAGVFCDFVVGQRERPLLCRRKPAQLDNWDFRKPKQLGSCMASVSGDDVLLLIDPDGYQEAERLNAVRDLADLLCRMRARIAPVRMTDVSGFFSIVIMSVLLASTAILRWQTCDFRGSLRVLLPPARLRGGAKQQAKSRRLACWPPG